MTRPAEQTNHHQARIGRVAGGVLLASVPLWWMGLQGWAAAQYGYLDPDVIGASPFMWVLLIAAAGLGLLFGLVPRPGSSVLNVAVGTAFALAAGALAIVNIAYGAADGISTAGWILGLLSAGQVAVVLGALIAASKQDR